VKKALKNVGTLAGVIVVGIVYFGGIAVLAFGLPIVGAIEALTSQDSWRASVTSGPSS
jgi:hypothetical protein